MGSSYIDENQYYLYTRLHDGKDEGATISVNHYMMALFCQLEKHGTNLDNVSIVDLSKNVYHMYTYADIEQEKAKFIIELDERKKNRQGSQQV